MGQSLSSSVLGFFKRRFGKEEVRILIQGLDAAGKTTMLYMLKLGEVVTTIPTIGFNVETIDYKNITFTAWDVGGRDKMRPLFRHYYPNTNALIFVIDSNDKERLPEIKEEIDRTLLEDELRDTIVLFIANKQDLPNALTKDEIAERLELNKIRGHDWYITEGSATAGGTLGYYEGLEWLSDQLTKQKVKGKVTKAIDNTKTDFQKEGQKYGTDYISSFFKSIANKFSGAGPS